MDEDEEEFYDSLDEDQQVTQYLDSVSVDPSRYELCEDDTPKTVIKPCEDDTPKPTPVKPTKIPVPEPKIPLYQGETAKEDLKIPKLKSTMKTPASSKTSKTCIACDKSKVKFTEAKKRTGGYWDLYCQKNGVSAVSDDGLTSFSGHTNSKIFKSFISSSSCLTGATWDAPSMFEKYVTRKYTDIQPTDTQSLKETKLNLDGEFKSVSNMDITKTPRVKNASKSKSNTSNASFRPLTLKCIGPDPQKLEQIKKQQDYGRKVSSRNRARIIQNLSKDGLNANK